MAGTTSPDNLPYLTTGDPVIDAAYTQNAMEAVQDALDDVQDALDSRQRTYRWANAAARTAQTGMIAGEMGYQIDTTVTYRYNGSAWKEWQSEWISWVTAPTNLTVGTGGSAATVQRYKWIGGRLYFEYKYVLGTSGGAVTGNPTLNMPLSLAVLLTGGSLAVGEGAVRDSSVPSTPAFTKANIATATTVIIQTYTGTVGNITATTPMTWAAGDILTGGFWGDPA